MTMALMTQRAEQRRSEPALVMRHALLSFVCSADFDDSKQTNNWQCKALIMSSRSESAIVNNAVTTCLG